MQRMLLEKQIQEQIAQASFRLAQDPNMSKSIRRNHKQTYEQSQQKISQLSDNISTLRQRRQSPVAKQISQDDIDLHRSPDNRFMQATAVVNPRNLNMLNMNNQISLSERRNSMKSTTSSLGSSSNTFIVQSPPSSATSLTSLKPSTNNIQRTRTRHDSCSTSRFESEYHKTESPTPSHLSLQHPQHVNVNQQLPLCSQSMKNIKIHESPLSPNALNYLNIHANQQAYMTAPQNLHALQFNQQQASRAMQQHAVDYKFLHRMHSFNHQVQHESSMRHESSPQIPQQQVHYNNNKIPPPMNFSPNHYTPSTAGLGGYWLVNENNQRVWCTDKLPLSPPPMPASNIMVRFTDSLIYFNVLTSVSCFLQSKKSNSLGNFDFMHKNINDEAMQSDSISISSALSNEHKRREKVW